MGNVRLVCLDADDLMHENTGESNYNESAYYNFYDPKVRLGGFCRIGNRPNEGYAEMTCCLYLPDGRVGFMYGRPKIPDNSKLDAGGMRFTVKTPMREHAVRYEGNVCLMARPLDLMDPRAAFTSNPHVPALVELAYTGVSPVSGGEPREEKDGEWVAVKVEKSGQEFARGHLEQHMHATGRVVVDGTTWTIDGYGLRDRSWGPRYWQAPDHYRWLTMNFGPGRGIAAARTVQRDGRAVEGGYIYEEGAPNRYIGKVEVESEFAGDEKLHAALRVRVHPVDGGAPEEITGRVLNMVPLRNRRDGTTTRIAEGLTEWRWGDRVGYGWSEYLDHVG
ncbi:MAG TPA: hypothetical protein VMS22_15175 [Candidatus Eisenbacteria bacterium]|nr:hypothetical protein [Candidatus Eisenbacteria bacterium]